MCLDNFPFLPKTSKIFSEKVQVLVASLSLVPTHQLMATQASILAPLTINMAMPTIRDLNLTHLAFRRLVGVLVRCQPPSVASKLNK